MVRVLVVDDEASISEAVAYALGREGYEVETAGDGVEALEKVEAWRPDVMVLDVMMPRMGGYDVCRKLAGRDRPAILLLTVKNDIVDKVLGLELGADDYMTKPFDIRELLARVKALARRMQDHAQPAAPAADTETVRLGTLAIDSLSRTARVAGHALDLTPKEFDLLKLLAANPERVYTREALLELVWDMDFAGGTRTVDIHVQRLRRKLGEAQSLIQTVFGVGYKSARPSE
ncbi:DNA-binding response regulator, OmpR family, contains REC and winged-helix (wHTH) domain [Cohnella sp. OV330]|uniref:response regulator transcription factor n=1 Tax=Cohnella sp. OV330 TaxID=1855288 RepID=UPI0008F06E88|nr:response regulator transcription factor [Cohnella sp. OV330]SFB50086.1 DNA-binding response regulator, OmpR family, contains REC and winged-helix (wHTH) domain [Cohnella sp. OV330]